MDWLLPVSLSIISAGIALSIYEEWGDRGLTDTSYNTLIAWVLGLCGVAAWGIIDSNSMVFLVAIVPALLFLYWIALKVADRSRGRRKGHR